MGRDRDLLVAPRAMKFFLGHHAKCCAGAARFVRARCFARAPFAHPRARAPLVRNPLLLALAFVLLPPGTAGAEIHDWRTRLDPRCVRLYERWSALQAEASSDARLRTSLDWRATLAQTAKEAGFGFGWDSLLACSLRVRVQVDAGIDRPAQGLSEACLARIPSARWEGAFGPWGQITLDIRDLPLLAEVPGIAYACLPPKAIDRVARPESFGRDRAGDPARQGEIVSAGATEIGAAAYQAAGWTGEDIRVGVLDLGFASLSRLLGREIPADTRWRSFFHSPAGEGDLTGGGDAHGTACAEIVHDVAPGARLYLANAYSTVEMAEAVDWMREEGVSVISHSVGWFFGPGDGTGVVSTIARSAAEHGILWVNAAGNQAQSYWQGDFVDSDGDAWNEFAPGDEAIDYAAGEGGDEFEFVLTWDRWPFSTDLSFAIEIWEDGILEATSADVYDQSWPYAYQDVSYERRSADAQVQVRIKRTRGEGDARLRLFRLDGDPIGDHGVPAGSVVMPADAPPVLSVGAYRAGAGFAEEFSSRGPTQAGAPKPELCGPDVVQTATFPVFGGTSAAAPHAAGAAALLLDAAPEAGFFDFHWTVDEMRSLFEWAASPATMPDREACVWGMLRLPPLRGSASPAQARLSACSPSRLPLRLRFEPERPGSYLASVYDAAGRALARIPLFAARAHEPVEWVWEPREASAAYSGWCWIRITGPGQTATTRALILP